MTFLRILLAVGIECLLLSFLSCTSGNSPALQVAPNSGRITVLRIDSEAIQLAAEGGGFSAYDATNKKQLVFTEGQAASEGLLSSFACEEQGIRLSAEFLVKPDYVLVTGELENLREDERGLLLDYRIPLPAEGATFSNGLNYSVPVSASSQEEGNAYPIAALSIGDSGVAMAIPPSSPRIFGMLADANGLGVRFYLGLSPLTTNFPNRASFSFIIYPVEGDWGFRSALNKYYSFYPERYTFPLKTDGLWMSQMQGRTPPKIEQYGFDMLEMLEETIQGDLERDRTHGIPTYPYILVGQREIKFLDKLPANYDEAMAIYDKWTLADHSSHPLTKESVASGGDLYLKEEVESSSCKGPNGEYAVTLRDTFWGGKSVTFTVNPSPELFKDKEVRTVGKSSIQLVKKWIGQYPEIEGILVDSLGPRWPSMLNYRKDHFPYARYPLTVDSEGRVAMHNQLTHYEFLEALRSVLPEGKKSVIANGITSFRTRESNTYRHWPEHYRGESELGRFFMSSLLDMSGSEAGIRATTERCQAVRAHMGRKLYSFLNYYWEDSEAVEEYFNRCLCFAIFATNTRNQFTGKEYLDEPDGYVRYAELTDWLVPKVRLLFRAGWEPVTYARTETENTVLERYGSGDLVYLAVFNDQLKEQTCAIELDWDALGFGPGEANITEIAQGTGVHLSDDNRLLLDMRPMKTYIVALQK